MIRTQNFNKQSKNRSEYIHIGHFQNGLCQLEGTLASLRLPCLEVAFVKRFF